MDATKHLAATRAGARGDPPLLDPKLPPRARRNSSRRTPPPRFVGSVVVDSQVSVFFVPSLGAHALSVGGAAATAVLAAGLGPVFGAAGSPVRRRTAQRGAFLHPVEMSVPGFGVTRDYFGWEEHDS